MRIIAAIYLTIMLVNFGIWLASGSVGDPFPTVYSYVMWSLYFLSVVALLAFVLRLQMLPQRAWQAVFVVYLVYRLVELVAAGTNLNGANPALNLNAVSTYLWLVVPPGLAMWFMGFKSAALRPSHRDRLSLPSVGHPSAQ